MTISIRELRNNLEHQKGRQAQIQTNLSKTQQRLETLRSQLTNHEQAREIIRIVGLKTQEQLSYHISEITTLALEAVYEDPYKLTVGFVQRRNKTECDLYFERDGMQVDPLSASGGGAVDVASFALRVASWSMQRPRSRNVLILDEPFKHLDRGRLPRASEMLKEISKELDLQIIMATHSEVLIEAADKTFEVTNHRGKSKVECS